MGQVRERPGITRRPLWLVAAILLFVLSVVVVMVFLKNTQAVATATNPPEKEYSSKGNSNRGPVANVDALTGGIIPAAVAVAVPAKAQAQALSAPSSGPSKDTGAANASMIAVAPSSQVYEKARKSSTEVFKSGRIPTAGSEALRAKLSPGAFSDANTLGRALAPALDMYGAVVPKEESETEKKEAFLAKRHDDFVLSHELQKPVSTYVLGSGAVIPAIMKEGIVSDLPGEVRAQVSQTVYDTPTGDVVVIPQGATLFGRYDAEVVYGQNRLLVAWHRLMYPDGSTCNLDAMSGADEAGAQGFQDQVHNHYGRIFGSAVLLSVISAGMQLSQPQRSVLQNQDAGQTAAAALGQNLGNVATQMVNKNLNIKPTITIRPGYRFVVKVNKDIRFEEPWNG